MAKWQKFLKDVDYHNGQDIEAHFRVPEGNQSSFITDMALAFGSAVKVTIGAVINGVVEIGAHITGKKAEEFISKTPGDKINR